MKRIRILAIMIAASLALLSAFALVRGAQEDYQLNQQGIFADVTTRLAQEGIPIKSSRLTEDSRCKPPLVAEYTLQSSSKGDKVTPDDPTYSNVVGREVNLAWKRGLNIGGTRVILVNTDGKVLSNVTSAIQKDGDWPAAFDQPSRLSVAEVSTLLTDFPTFGLSRQGLKVSLNREGLMTVTFDIQADNAEKASSVLAGLIGGTSSRLTRLNQEQGTQIAVYKINITDAMGQPLLKYINDVQFGHLSWWQTDTLTKDWYPQPGPNLP